jgi:hypothetical protein
VYFHSLLTIVNRGDRSPSYPTPLCCRKRSPHFILNRRKCGAQNSYECFVELKSILLLPAIKSPTELSHLHYLHASTANVSVTVDCLTRSLFLPPHTPPSKTPQFGPQRAYFMTLTFSPLSKNVTALVDFSSLFLVILFS